MAGIARTKVLYVTIDEYDRLAPGEWGHANNVARLAEIAGKWAVSRGRRLEVETAFFPSVNEATLEGLFALWIAGSWVEWQDVRLGMGKDKRGPQTYGEALSPFMKLVRETTVPTFATCGGHHLVAAAYAGWRAVGHVLGKTIDDELREGKSYIPSPRPGEIGGFAESLTDAGRRDPIFAGFGDGPHYFIQHHHDEVKEAHRSPEFVSLLSPADAPAIQDTATRPEHRPVEGLAERCRVQGLRHTSKLLYTFQLHPELPAAHVAPELDPAQLAAHRAAYDSSDANGERLVMNFFDLADRTAR